MLNVDYRALRTGATIININGKELAVKKLIEALEYQLTERLKFVKGPDPVVASLLFDFAALEAGTGTLETATDLLKMAKGYGYSSERIDPLIAKYGDIIKVAGLRNQLFIAGASSFAAAFLVFSYKRKWLVLSRAGRRST